jgi:hypothetical protein
LFQIKKITRENYLKEYLLFKKAEGRSERTIKDYGHHVKHFFKRFITWVVARLHIYAARGFASGEWYPWRIEQVFGDTQVTDEDENGKLFNHPRRMADFISFSTMFAGNLLHQDWKDAKIKKYKA